MVLKAVIKNRIKYIKEIRIIKIFYLNQFWATDVSVVKARIYRWRNERSEFFIIDNRWYNKFKVEDYIKKQTKEK